MEFGFVLPLTLVVQFFFWVLYIANAIRKAGGDPWESGPSQNDLLVLLGSFILSFLCSLIFVPVNAAVAASIVEVTGFFPLALVYVLVHPMMIVLTVLAFRLFGKVIRFCASLL